MTRKRTVIAPSVSTRPVVRHSETTKPKSLHSGWVLAVPDLDHGSLSRGDAELIGAARKIARDLALGLVILSFDEHARIEWGKWGADAVVRARRRTAGNYEPEVDAEVVGAVIDEWAPRHCLFPDGIPGFGDVGRRVVTMRNADCVAGVVDIHVSGVRAAACGGARQFKTRLPPFMFVASGVACEPEQCVQTEIIESTATQPRNGAATPRLLAHGVRSANASALSLTEAQFVVAAGNGVSDWTAFRAVAKALNASVAGSRVVCDRGTLPKTCQVGTSGVSVSARCYVAFGIAGAPEHLAGITNCTHVVAVNTDPSAPMLLRADLAIVADADAILRTILTLVPSALEGVAA